MRFYDNLTATRNFEAPGGGSGGNADPVELNRRARNALIPSANSRTVRRTQQIGSVTNATYAAGQQLVIPIIPAPAGIITRFLIKVTASVGIGGAETQTRVQNGAASFFSNVQYIDTSNQTRINCPSWYLNLLSMHRRRRMFGAAATYDISNICGPGAAYTPGIFAAPASLTLVPPANNAPNFAAYFEVPLAYGFDDLRGAVLASFLNATQSLQLTINPNFFVTSTDQVNVAEAAYQSSTAQLGKISYLTVTVYQEYIDQFGGMALPQIDLATQYLLQTSGGFQPTPNVDLTIPYINYRFIMTTLLRYNNSGVFNAGSDINYLAIRTANSTDLERMDPYSWALREREHTGSDMPAGYYMINHRQKPIFTNNYGNVSLVAQMNAVTGINSTVLVGYEQLALTNMAPASGAIPSGG